MLLKIQLKINPDFKFVKTGDGVSMMKHGWYLIHIDDGGIYKYESIGLGNVDTIDIGKLITEGVDIV